MDIKSNTYYQNITDFFFCFQRDMVENPWLVDSIHDFSSFQCPECIFNSKEEPEFKNHAIENHPLSIGKSNF